MTLVKNIQHPTFAIAVGAWLVLLRLATAAWIPLMESTEARYGEIARKMLETGNWVYLQNTYDSPFWAKPPMYAWLSAASMGIFGVSEFAVRLPAILLGIATVYLVFVTARRHFSPDLATRAALILATLFGFFLGMGTVMTDPSLVFCVTLSLCSWWNFHTRFEKKWGLLFFAGIGAGLLAKGPLAIVLIGLPILFYLIAYKGRMTAIISLPWGWGSVIGFALPISWYVLAEFKTPGFIEYFVLGEHVSRFLKSGWTGDLYGNAHSQPFGTIWVYAALGLLPWSLLLAGRFIQAPRVYFVQFRADRCLVFLGLWCLTHLLFFSFAANITWSYFLPMAPAFAMLCAALIEISDKMFRWLSTVIVACFSITAIIASDMFLNQGDNYTKSVKSIIVQLRLRESVRDDRLAYYSRGRIFSAEFYTNGKIQWASSPDSIARLVNDNMIDYILVGAPDYGLLSDEIRKEFLELPGYPKTRLNLEMLKRRSKL